MKRAQHPAARALAHAHHMSSDRCHEPLPARPWNPAASLASCARWRARAIGHASAPQSLRDRPSLRAQPLWPAFAARCPVLARVCPDLCRFVIARASLWMALEGQLDFLKQPRPSLWSLRCVIETRTLSGLEPLEPSPDDGRRRSGSPFPSAVAVRRRRRPRHRRRRRLPPPPSAFAVRRLRRRRRRTRFVYQKYQNLAMFDAVKTRMCGKVC